MSERRKSIDNGASSYRRFLEGDDNGFVSIIDEYMDGLLFYLNSLVGDIHIAEDLTEDTFVKIITKKTRFLGKSTFKTWLYSIGRNTAVDYLKKKSKYNLVALQDCVQVSDDEISLELSYIREERKIIVHRALKRLKPEYRQIIWLIYFEGFNNKEASVIMRKSIHNIETLVYRARRSLKSELEKEGFVYEES